MNRKQQLWSFLFVLVAVCCGMLIFQGSPPLAVQERSANRVSPPGPMGNGSRVRQWNELIADEFAGDEACESCHPVQFGAHQRSGHSQTLTPMAGSQLASELASRGTWQDPRRDLSFDFGFHDDRFFIASENLALAVNWLIGSGKRAQTPIATDATGRHGTEIRLTAFGRQRELGLTPDHERFDSYTANGTECFGRPMDASDVRSCLGCHSTAIPPAALPLDEAAVITNVGCERCHGPRGAHVISARQGRAEEATPMLKFETAEAYLEICSACHRDATSVRPDAPQADLVRFQPYGLQRSRCFIESAGTMTCSTCHDPHDAPSSNHRNYIQQCQQCHQQSRSTDCPSEPSDDCVACHMPEVEWTAGITFHDHFIRVPEFARNRNQSRSDKDQTSPAQFGPSPPAHLNRSAQR